MSTCAMSICVMSSCVTSIFVMSICAMSSYVMSVCVCVMSICVVSVCEMSICVMSICEISICVMSTCVMSICVMSSCVTTIFVMSICAMSSCVMSVCVCVMSICVVSVCVMSICVMPICVHSYPKRNLHTARRQTRMPARHPHKIFAPPIGTTTQNAIYTQQGTKPACQQDIRTKFSHLLLAQLPRTQFTHSKARNPHVSKTSAQNFRISYWHSYPERNLHTARRQTRTPAGHHRQQARRPANTKAYIRPRASAKIPHACHAKVQRPARRPANTKAYIRPPAAPQVPRLPRKSPAASAAAREHQSVHQTPCSAASPTPATQKSSGQRGGPRTPKRTSDPLQRRKSHPCHAKVQRPARRPANTKAYIRPPAVPQVPRLPRKSPAASAAAREHQSVHQTPCRCSKSHACHAKAAAASAAAREHQSVHQTPCKCSQSHACHAKAAAASAAAREHQSIHQTPCRCSKSHACHAKAARQSGSAYVNLCDVKLCDVKLCDVNLCDVKL